MTRVHEVLGTGFMARNYTLYTLQYTLSWLPSPTGECDRRYSEFEAFHGERALAMFSFHQREHPWLTVLLVLCLHVMVISERVVAHNFVGLDGLTPAELVQHFPVCPLHLRIEPPALRSLRLTAARTYTHTHTHTHTRTQRHTQRQRERDSCLQFNPTGGLTSCYFCAGEIAVEKFG